MSYLSDRVVLLCEHQCSESIKFIFQIFKWFKDIKSRIFVFKKHKKHGILFFNLNFAQFSSLNSKLFFFVFLRFIWEKLISGLKLNDKGYDSPIQKFYYLSVYIALFQSESMQQRKLIADFGEFHPWLLSVIVFCFILVLRQSLELFLLDQ